MYQGNCAVAAFPALGSPEFYNELDAVWDHLSSESTPVFQSGKEFKEVLKVILAKISIGDWSSFDSTLMNMKFERLEHDLFTTIIPTGEMLNRKGEKLPLTFSNGTLVPDDMLKLSFCAEGEKFDLLDTGLVLSHDQAIDPSQLVTERQQYFTERHGHRNDHTDAKIWTKNLQEYLTALCQRRRQRVLLWLEDRTSLFPEEGSVDRLQTAVTKALGLTEDAWTICQEDICSRCFYFCLLGKYHEGDHDCLGDHRCKHACDFCKDLDSQEATGQPRQADANVPTVMCGDKAGHGGRHNCQETNHTCGKMCELAAKANCNWKCALEVNHEGPHRCNVKLHHCGKPCNLNGCCPKKCTKHRMSKEETHVCGPSCQLSCCCPRKCTKPCEDNHTDHACTDHACRQFCPIPNCGKRCSETGDHFHGFDKEHGIFLADVNHFCGSEHACPELCAEKGICKINSEMKCEEDVYTTGEGSEIRYKSFTVQEGIRAQCSIPIPRNQLTHAGAHTCKSTTKHFCEERCPMCKYICNLPIDHRGEHRTVHGNMRETEVISASSTFVVGEHIYARGDSGKAEMCNMHCKSLGRGHIHLEPCSDGAQNMSMCSAHDPRNGRRHQKEATRYCSKDGVIQMDELKHEAYWRMIGFEDPCDKEDQELFGMCGVKCGSEEHEADAKTDKNCCTEHLWHEPATLAQLRSKFNGEGYIHSTGHHFPCKGHGKPLHHIFIVDKSGSMGCSDHKPTMPTLLSSHPNRLGAVINACYQYLDHRQTEETSNDKVSFVQFNNTASTLFEAEQLDPEKLLSKMKQLTVGGGTSFSPVS